MLLTANCFIWHWSKVLRLRELPRSSSDRASSRQLSVVPAMGSMFLGFQPPEVCFKFHTESAQETQHKTQTVNLTFPWSPIRTINQAQICFELGRACPRKFRNFNDPLGQSQAHSRAFTKKTSNCMDFMWFCYVPLAQLWQSLTRIRFKLK